MNKRKWKKQYKKQHGFNPISWRKNASLTDIYNNVFNDFIEKIKRLLSESFNKIKSFINDIQTMDEEDFNKMINEHPELTAEEIEQLKNIRKVFKDVPE